MPLVRAIFRERSALRRRIVCNVKVNAIRALSKSRIDTKVLVTFVDRNNNYRIDKPTERFLDVLNSMVGVTISVRDEVSFAGRAIAKLKEYAPRLSVAESLEGYCSMEDEHGKPSDLE